MDYYYYPEVKYLLLNKPQGKVGVSYGNSKFRLPIIGPRPPFYINPSYQHYYPKI